MITIDDLARIMREHAGEAAALVPDLADVPFAELGYDSLAVLETAARLETEYSVRLSDDDIDAMETPRAFVDLVNRRLRSPGDGG
ncbi:MAG: acyl carrier protein [Nonomuraea sp.]|nr:acyl carrier protein [Nonomuraea sp.]